MDCCSMAEADRYKATGHTFSGTILYECQDCGASVSNTEKHDEWHERLGYTARYAWIGYLEVRRRAGLC